MEWFGQRKRHCGTKCCHSADTAALCSRFAPPVRIIRIWKIEYPTGKIIWRKIIHYCNYNLGSGALESGGLDPDPNDVCGLDWCSAKQFCHPAKVLVQRSEREKKTQTLQNDKCALNYSDRHWEYKIITEYILILEKIMIQIKSILFPIPYTSAPHVSL